MSHGRLIIVCGLPGAGKTTLARRLGPDMGGVRFCPDEWMAALAIDIYDSDARSRIEGLQWCLVEEVLTGGGIAIIEWGTWARSERDDLYAAARALGAAVELRWLDVGADELWRRVQARGMEQHLGSRPLTRADVETSVAAFEPPTVEELGFYDKPAVP